MDYDLDAIGDRRFQLVGRTSGASLIVIFHKLDLLPVPSTRGVNAVESVADSPAVRQAAGRLWTGQRFDAPDLDRRAEDRRGGKQNRNQHPNDTSLFDHQTSTPFISKLESMLATGALLNTDINIAAAL